MRYNSIFVLITLFALSGCYKFANAPFDGSDLTAISKSELFQQIYAARDKIPNSDQGREVKNSLGNIDKVYEISPSLVVGQEYKNGGYDLSVMMKNEHHILMCTLMGDDSNESAPGVNITAGNGPFDPKRVDGEANAVRQWAENYVLNGPKLCIAVPFADARTVKSENGSWFSNLFN